MTIPIEFTSEYLQAHSAPENQLYREFLRCGEPWRSMFSNNPWLIPPDPREPLPKASGQYWDTTAARKHPYWKDLQLPVPTYDIEQLRRDISQWGYCLIKDAMSPAQCERFRSRLMDQAAGERLAGIAQPTPSGQYVNTLINKGAVFAACIEQSPDAVQGGPVIEQLLDETLGKGWICHSFLANGADPGGYPQGMHIDQGPLLPWVTEAAPASITLTNSASSPR